MTRRARRVLFYAGLLAFCAGWTLTIGKAIDFALDTWARTWP